MLHKHEYNDHYTTIIVTTLGGLYAYHTNKIVLSTLFWHTLSTEPKLS